MSFSSTTATYPTSFPLFAGAWPVLWTGLVNTSADTSLTAPTNFTTLGTVGSDTKLVQPGGVSTRVTATFTVAVVSSSNSITCADTSGFRVGDYVWVSDGAHAFFGTLTAIGSSTTMTVTTNQVNIGAAGNTMNVGAFIQYCAPINTSGVKIEEINCRQIATNSGACYVNVFAYDGATSNYVTSFKYSSIVTFSATQQDDNPQAKFDQNLQLPMGWSLRITCTIASSPAAFRVQVKGGYYG